MHKPKSIKDLLRSGGLRIGALQARTQERGTALAEVRGVLPPALAATVVSAGLEHGTLTIGVTGAVWAGRLRYLVDALRSEVGAALDTQVRKVRIRVVPSRAT